MPLHAESTLTRRSGRDKLPIWNRKAHYYLGLYFLFFLWLFAFTGLLLNHSWAFAEFWPQRRVVKSERQVSLPAQADDLVKAREVMRQLGIAGEVEWTAARPDSTAFSFRAARPGRTWSIAVSGPGQASIEQTDVNGWGVLRVLHTFTGVRAGDARNQRDWLLTTVWALAMDAVALGLAVMVFSGLYMWACLPAKRKLGLAALAAGTTVCGFLVFGLRWLY